MTSFRDYLNSEDYKEYTIISEIHTDLITATVIALDYQDEDHLVFSFWRELKHMEKNGFDVARHYRELHCWFTKSEYSPFKNDNLFAIEREKAIVLTLRERMRWELDMMRLTETDMATWQYVALDPFEKHIWEGNDYNDAPDYPDEGAKIVAEYISNHDKDFANYAIKRDADLKAITQTYQTANISNIERKRNIRQNIGSSYLNSYVQDVAVKELKPKKSYRNIIVKYDLVIKHLIDFQKTEQTV